MCIRDRPNYSLVSQSISETAAQATPGAWVARSGFALLGMAVLSARSHAQVGRPSAMAYSAFALGLFGVGVWSHEPYLADLPYDATEASLHSLVAAGMGLAIVTAEVLAAWHTPVSYTHLDVYKRQVRGRGQRSRPGA